MKFEMGSKCRPFTDWNSVDSSPLEKHIEGLPSETQKNLLIIENSRPQLHILEYQNTKFRPEISCFKEKTPELRNMFTKKLGFSTCFFVSHDFFGHKTNTLSQRVPADRDPMQRSARSACHPVNPSIRVRVGEC